MRYTQKYNIWRSFSAKIGRLKIEYLEGFAKRGRKNTGKIKIKQNYPLSEVSLARREQEARKKNF